MLVYCELVSSVAPLHFFIYIFFPCFCLCLPLSSLWTRFIEDCKKYLLGLFCETLWCFVTDTTWLWERVSGWFQTSYCYIAQLLQAEFVCVLALVTFLPSIDGHYLFCPFILQECATWIEGGAHSRSHKLKWHNFPVIPGSSLSFVFTASSTVGSLKPLLWRVVFHAWIALLAWRVWPKTIMKQLNRNKPLLSVFVLSSSHHT